MVRPAGFFRNKYQDIFLLRGLNLYSVEMDHDDIEITIMDDHAFNEDVKVDVFDDIVFIRQWDDNKDCHDIVSMSQRMWEELILAIHSPEGFFQMRKKEKA